MNLDRLWSAANRLRGTVEAAEYKHIILGLLFLKYLSDAFENRRRFLARAVADPANTAVKEVPAEYIASVAEDKGEYLVANIFWIPPQACWSYLLANAHRLHLGWLIDEATAAIEKEKEPEPVARRTPEDLRPRRHSGADLRGTAEPLFGG